MMAGWTHSHTCVVTGSPARVFTALISPDELRQWFAEHVEVDARPGGAFRFWGTRTYGTPSALQAQQRLTRIEQDSGLGFTWDFDGAGTEVQIALVNAPEGGADRTQLTLQHHFPAQPHGDHAVELVDDLWRFTIGNLDAHTRGGGGVVLQDFSDPSPEIRLSIVIDAPRERVFAALIDPAALNSWIARQAVVEPRVGGRYSYGWEYTVGDREVLGGPTRILDLVQNERLVTDWPDWRGDPTKPLTRVAWLLESLGAAQTRVTVVHGEFPRVVDIGDYPFGWGSFLGQLKDFLCR